MGEGETGILSYNFSFSVIFNFVFFKIIIPLKLIVWNCNFHQTLILPLSKRDIIFKTFCHFLSFITQ